MTRPKITVITPVYNRAGKIMRAINSVLTQNFCDFEYIVVDDSSTDETAAIVAQVNDPRISLLQLPERQGANSARNLGIKRANSELITFLDSDDEFLPDRLELITEFFEGQPSCNLMISSFETRKRSEADSDKTSPGSNPEAFVPPEQLEILLFAHAVYIAGSAISIRSPLLKRIGGFDQDLMRMQDRDLLLRLSCHCGAYLSPTIDWVKHRSNDSISGERGGYLSSLNHLFSKHQSLRKREPELAGYLVGRNLLANFLQGRIKLAFEGLAANKELEHFRFTLPKLLMFYWKGKQQRLKVRNEAASFKL
mgnify:CR=1 FL=1